MCISLAGLWRWFSFSGVQEFHGSLGLSLISSQIVFRPTSPKRIIGNVCNSVLRETLSTTDTRVRLFGYFFAARVHLKDSKVCILDRGTVSILGAQIGTTLW